MEDTIQILMYLKGNMDAQEKKAFEERLNNEPDLVDELELHRYATRKLQDKYRDDIGLKAINQVRAELKNEKFYQSTSIDEEEGKVISFENFSQKWTFRIAASLALLIIAGLLIYNNLKTNNRANTLDQLASQTPKEEMSEQLKLIIEGSGFTEKSEDIDKLLQALENYNQQDYEKAIPKFETYLDSNKNDAAAKFYLAICYLKIDNKEEAIQLLETVIEIEKLSLSEKAAVILSSLYMQKDEDEKASSVINRFLKRDDLDGEIRTELKTLKKLIK